MLEWVNEVNLSEVPKVYASRLFVIGFLFDILATGRIDQTFSLVQQVIYLFFIMIFVYWEVVTPQSFFISGSILNKLWNFHIEVLHFLFGSLLSLYTIFYFKSASLVTSFIFMAFLATLLVVNELPQFKKRGLSIRFALLALCLSSYFIYLVPVASGKIGVVSFIVSIVISMGLFLLVCVRIMRKLQDKDFVNKRLLAPGLIVQLIFVFLYFFKALPPVPISLKFIGIYQNIQVTNNSYYLDYERSWWRFWENGAQTFVKREGDSLYCFMSIFSPTQFKDNMKVDWYKYTKSGWTKQDSIPLSIKGGRDQGYRGYVYKSNFQLGQWQVRVMTSDKREVGRLSVNVVDADPTTQRKWRQDIY